ncbi:MAG: hypothetical protein LBC20_02220 [Planctomycetaceae bacterium]|jgi:hypothetical protein|nr:hypothetical protein [Planctomycetaceae bacterium]
MPIPLFLIVPDRRLIRAIHVADEQHQFEITRFRSLQHALEKGNTDKNSPRLLIVQWNSEDILKELAQNKSFNPIPYSSRLIVYYPELSQKTPAEGEEIRFALLQLKIITVFSQLRELPSVLDIAQHYANRFTTPQKQWTQIIDDTLPWKK